MRILFNLMTTIEVPDAEEYPPIEEVEKEFANFFQSEGMIAHGLEITDYFRVDTDKEEAVKGVTEACNRRASDES